MEFDEVVRRRRMIRRYDPDRPVPPDLLDKILRHGLRAPSAGFAQGWSFLVLTAADDRERWWRVTADPDGTPRRAAWLARMRTAPAVVVCFANRSAYEDRYAQADKGWIGPLEERWTAPYWEVDTGFAALLMHLTAVNEGLGSCFFGLPAPAVPRLREAFGVPERFTPIGALTIGYRADDKRSPSLRRGQRGVAEVVHHGRWAAIGATSESATSEGEPP